MKFFVANNQYCNFNYTHFILKIFLSYLPSRVRR